VINPLSRGKRSTRSAWSSTSRAANSCAGNFRYLDDRCKLILGFLALAWLSLVGILSVAPEVYDQSLRLPSGAGGAGSAELLFVGALSTFILFIAVGVARRWRWIFWLLVVAFLSGILRLPVSTLELAGWLPAAGPSWYLIVQALIGVAQFAIALVMLIEYRRHGMWGRSAGSRAETTSRASQQ
jgi:hypothetical protein